MKFSDRPLLLALVGALTLSVCVAAPAQAADPTFPTGTFSAGPTSQMMFGYQDVTSSAYVSVAPTSLYDDTTPLDALVLTLDGGKNADGVGPKEVRPCCGTHLYEWSVRYQAAGVYTPKVTLKDQDGNTTVVDLKPITVLRDITPPVARVSIPSPRLRDTVRGWQTLRGTATDTQTKVWQAYAVVMQRRAGIWYAYDQDKSRWLKGTRDEASTLTTLGSNHQVTTTTIKENTWALPRLRGLTRGLLVIRAGAHDLGGNSGQAPTIRYQLRRP